MPGKPKRLEHPKIVYFVGFIFGLITIAVVIGVAYHLSFSPHGPAVLRPLTAKFEEGKSTILDEVRQHEEFEKHRHFHHTVSNPQLPEQKRPVCYICHSDYPHGKNKKVRALLNMHTQFFVCETCHLEQQEGQAATYKWYNPLDDDPKGPFFGTSYDPATGNLIEGDDPYSKISPYIHAGGKIESAIQRQDAPLALDYMKVKDTLTPEQRDNVKKKFHVNIKAKGHECKTCHSKGGILNFKQLGFAENRAMDLEQLNIAGMMTKYEKFYIPNLFQ
ncbi:MAG: hypothetical protein HY806_00560 [Nitrospirae bacterium]|nr:hypothetical protein [Nitrospirota bacterium]